jgi:hypothetical protein
MTDRELLVQIYEAINNDRAAERTEGKPTGGFIPKPGTWAWHRQQAQAAQQLQQAYEAIQARLAEPEPVAPVRITLPQQAEPVGWLRAVDEAMAVYECGVADPADDYGTAKSKLNTLLCIVQDAGSNFGSYFVKLQQQQAEPAAEPPHWVITTKIGDIVGFVAPGLKKGDKVYPPPQQAEPLVEHPNIAGMKAALDALAQQAEPVSALKHYNETIAETGDADMGGPLERLRFFCSLSMPEQDWLDVEPFFDAVEKEQADAVQQIAEALRQHGLTLVKTASGYVVWKLGNVTARSVQAQATDPCPSCPPGQVCRTPACGRLKLAPEGT